jgi:flagellar protein FlbT
VTFLLESHVMQAKDAATLTRQIYFAVQIMLMDPTAAAAPLARSLIKTALGAYRSPELVSGLRGVAHSLARGRNFEAMKALRALFPPEDRELAAGADPGSGNDVDLRAEDDRRLRRREPDREIRRRQVLDLHRGPLRPALGLAPL